MDAVGRGKQKVRAYLKAWGLNYDEPLENAFRLGIGSVIVFIAVIPWDDGAGAILDFRAHIVSGVEPSSSLYRHIARNQPLLGSLSVWEDEEGENNIVFAYSTLADYLDEPEFRHNLGVFVAIADELDDELASTFGGRVALDA